MDSPTQTQPDKIEQEDRIDDFAVKAYQSMGYTERLSENMVILYNEFKRRKDKLQPGRPSPEALALIAIMAAMVDGDLVLADGDGKE